MRSSTRRILGFTALAALAQHAGCAHIRPLEGGAADESPPHLVSSLPADSSRGLGRAPVLELHFDEALNATPAAAAVRTYPSQPRPEVRVRGTQVEIRYRDSLPPDTTFAVVLGEGFQDAAGRGNELAGEIWLVFATADTMRGGAVFGRVRAKGQPEPQAAVRFEPLAAIADSIDSLRLRPGGSGIRPRAVVAAADAEGLFRLLALPAGKPFVLRAFIDRNRSLDVDDDELAAVHPETLQLRDGEVRRGLEWNLVDPNEPGTIRGVAFNRTDVAGRIAVALRAVDLAGEPTVPGAADSTRHDSLGARSGVDSSLAAEPLAHSPAVVEPLGAESLPVAPVGVWEQAYAALGSWGSQRQTRGSMETPTVYASPRGDYSLRARPGRQRLFAFIDASGDSLPGTYIAADSLHREWEPLWVGGILDVVPAAEIRPRSIDIEAPQ